MSNTKYTPETFRPLLKRLVETPEYFSSTDLVQALNHVFTPDTIHPEQIGAFLTALHVHRVERRPESLAAAAQVLRERSLKAEIDGMQDDFVVDIVGTGGDGWNLFNVSTTAGVVAAGAGARVIKHGSRASTSSSGSADLLQALGCIFVRPSDSSSNSNSNTNENENTPIPSIPFTFILAPHYHPALSFLAPYRKNLPFRTMFNILGPLINPAKPKGILLGIAEPELGWTFAKSLKEGGVERALVVCGEEKMDEVSCAGPTTVWGVGVDLEEAVGGKEVWGSLEIDQRSIDGIMVTKVSITPEMFGLPTHPLKDVVGGKPEENAEVFREMLADPSFTKTKTKKDLTPILDFTLLNASTLLVISGLARSFRGGTEMARKGVESGKAWEVFQAFKEVGRG